MKKLLIILYLISSFINAEDFKNISAVKAFRQLSISYNITVKKNQIDDSKLFSYVANLNLYNGKKINFLFKSDQEYENSYLSSCGKIIVLTGSITEGENTELITILNLVNFTLYELDCYQFLKENGFLCGHEISSHRATKTLWHRNEWNTLSDGEIRLDCLAILPSKKIKTNVTNLTLTYNVKSPNKLIWSGSKKELFENQMMTLKEIEKIK